MQCRWAGCIKSRKKGHRKYCQTHIEESTAQALDIMSTMFRTSAALMAIAKPKRQVYRDIEVKPSKGISAADRDRLDREQTEINRELDQKCGYGNGAPQILSQEEIAELIPEITPIHQIKGPDKRRRTRRTSWQKTSSLT